MTPTVRLSTKGEDPREHLLEMTGNDPEEGVYHGEIDELVERIEDLEASNKTLSNHVEEFERQLADGQAALYRERHQRCELETQLVEERCRREKAEQTAQAAVAHVRQLWSMLENEIDIRKQNVAGIHGRISAELEDVEAGDDDAVGETDELLPIQQFARMSEQAADQQLNNENHRNTYRARAIWKGWSDYAEKTPAGSVIRSGRLQRVLRAQAEDDHAIETWTAKRVMDRLVEFSYEIVDRKKKHGEWLVVRPDDWREQVEEAVGDQSDAAVSQGG